MTTIYFATNRNPIPQRRPRDFGPGFGPDGLDNVRFGVADVPGDSVDDITFEVFDESLDTKAPEGQKLGSKALFSHLQAKMGKHERDTMFYVHGYDFTFKEALLRTAELKRWFGQRPMNWLVFTWPSDGEKIPFKSYRNDRKDAAASGLAIARGILKAADFVRTVRRPMVRPGQPRELDLCEQRVHLMAHSMGNFALMNAVQAMRTFVGNELPRLFDEVLLMAADADNDALEKDDRLALLERLGRRVSTYYNAQDLALVVSDWTKMNPDRLGATGPRRAETLPPKFSQLNCSVIIDHEEDPTGHQYYRNNPRVRADIFELLDGTEDEDIAGRTYRRDRNYYRLEPGT